MAIDAAHDKDGGLTGFAMIMRNITEPKATASLIDGERQFRLWVAGVTDYAIFMLDSRGIVMSWNAGAERIKQYAAWEIVGQHFSRFYTEEDRTAGTPQLALDTATEEGRFESEGWRVRRDGTLFWASVVIDAIRDEGGRPIGFAKITRDITERRDAQAALQQAQERLAQTQKMEALGRLAAGVAHDFNNLLMILGGHAQALKRRIDGPQDAGAIDAILQAARRGASLTRHLLTFSRRQALNPTAVDLQDRRAEIRELLLSSIRHDIELAFDIAADVWSVEIDISELELALVNIAVNARDAMPGGGRIAISAANAALNGGSEVEDLRGDFVALSVTDTGIGIAPDIMSKVFEPFFAAKQVGDGTGLGLSQVYGFARQSGGAVNVTSEVGRGTTVTLYLPRSRAAAAAGVAQDRGTAAGAEESILLVEDNPEVAEIAKELLEELGYRITHVVTAAAALEVLRSGMAVDLVFSDIVMPGSMSGVELARETRRNYPEMPVLLTSGYSNVLQATEREFHVIRKPYQLSALAQAVRDAIDTMRQDSR